MKNPLTDFTTFIAVAKHASFRLAGEELEISSSAVSHSIRLLEQRLKIRLFSRTTRSVSLTEAGQQLYDRLRPAFEDIHLTIDQLNQYRDSPMGSVRINAVRQGARLYLSRVVAGFVARYPDIKVEITTDDRITDIVSGQFDAGVRLNAIVEKDMIALPIGPSVRFVVVAAPEYFAQHGKPATPEELVQHQCVRFQFPSGRPYYWEFERAGNRVETAVGGNITVDDLDLEMDLVLQGAGVGYLLYDQVADSISSGALVCVLDEWLPERPGFQLYYPSRKYLSYGFRTFIDYIKQSERAAT
jgi:DNA-binding transcriptional LysR family regulator